MKNMRRVYKSLIILTVVVLSMLLAGCEDDGVGKCLGCGIHTSWRYVPYQGWWCYSCTH